MYIYINQVIIKIFFININFLVNTVKIKVVFHNLKLFF